MFIVLIIQHSLLHINKNEALTFLLLAYIEKACDNLSERGLLLTKYLGYGTFLVSKTILLYTTTVKAFFE